MNEICDFLLAWTLERASGDSVTIGEQTIEHTCSPEVIDRAISVIGIVVPVSLWLLVLVCFGVACGCFWRLFVGKRG